MSQVNTDNAQQTHPQPTDIAPQDFQKTDRFVPPAYDTPHVSRQYEDLIDQVAKVIAPVWPLKDFVAVNPYKGLADRSFLSARAFLKVFSDCETLMPLGHFSTEFKRGRFSRTHVETALAERRATGIESSISSEDITGLLGRIEGDCPTTQPTGAAENSHRQVRTIAEQLDRHAGAHRPTHFWTDAIRDEVSKHCAAHFDQGQAVWASPWKDLPLFQAWRSAAVHDRNIEALGLTGFRAFVRELPHTPEAAIVHCLDILNVPEPAREAVLLCQAFSIPGWTAWTRYNDEQTPDIEEGSPKHANLAGLLAMRLAYDAALVRAFDFHIDWRWFIEHGAAAFSSPKDSIGDDTELRDILQRSMEIAHRSRLLADLTPAETHAVEPTETERALARMVFCIDVRSERIRRHLEAASARVQTSGFAGFFGMPIEFVPLGHNHGSSHVPALINPAFPIGEHVCESTGKTNSEVKTNRSRIRGWRKLWKSLQTNAVGCFPFVETAGILSGLKLVKRTFGFGTSADDARFDGLAADDPNSLVPALRDPETGEDLIPNRLDVAEGMLNGLGLKSNFPRLVIFCGHGSQVENNPLRAGLDCGACCGHSGEPNARMAALLLNDAETRKGLAERGIHIPEDTHFLAGLHNTTTDRIKLFDLSALPETHTGDLEEIRQVIETAGERTRTERLPIIGGDSTDDPLRRAADWSEVRPEWGLAGNAAFVVGPRSLTAKADLDGRSFLHDYEASADPDGAVLETIMTAPMIVTHWINMQYYASTVDNVHFGSGHKTVHNVVGRFGILSGNGGDLQTGLPWQSIHTGERLQHEPLRLQVVIAAPRERIASIIGRHEHVENLLANEWLHLVAIDGGVKYRYTTDGEWVVV